MKKSLVGMLGLSLIAPAAAIAETSFTIKNDVNGTKISTVSEITRDCAVKSNDGKTLKITCDANILPNNIQFAIEDNKGNNIGFINASNPIYGSAVVELRDPKNEGVLSTCYASGKCVIGGAIDSKHSSGNYLVTHTEGDGNIILVKNIEK